MNHIIHCVHDAERKFNAETTGVHFHILLLSITKFDQQIVFVFAKQRFAFLGNKGKIMRPVCGIKIANMRQFFGQKRLLRPSVT